MTGDEDNVGSSRRSLSTTDRKSSSNASSRDRRRYKTELCHQFEENGNCCYGSRCQFAHGRADLRSVIRHPKYKTDLCRTFHTTGLCPYGPRCHFIHNNDDRSRSAMSADAVRLEAPGVLPLPPTSSMNVDNFDSERRLLERVLLAAGRRSDPAVCIVDPDFLPLPRHLIVDLRHLDVMSKTYESVDDVLRSTSSSPARGSCGSVAGSSRSTSRSASFSFSDWTLVD